ncbi:MAG: hypothetical protein BAJALOKI2v1_120032 [Promethearchaeota archaeon]|nr:MAG: hypothetical protein BAJALOKI2v1_120032 [Candidatus Lokiarchaeota archaeon]
MKKVTDEDKLFYFEKHFFTLDGLWMIETENEVGWEKALKIDLIVWKRLLKIAIRRIKRYLNISTNHLKDLIDILTFRWSIEGWNYKVLKNTENEVSIAIQKCPYVSIMERNPDRHDKIPLICKDMCIPFYENIVKNFNPDINMKRTKYIGLGDEICNFIFSEDYSE